MAWWSNLRSWPSSRLVDAPTISRRPAIRGSSALSIPHINARRLGRWGAIDQLRPRTTVSEMPTPSARHIIIVLVVVAIAGCDSTPSRETVPSSTMHATSAATASDVPRTPPVAWCGTTVPRRGPVPVWAQDGPIYLRHIASAHGEAIGFLFAEPLTAPPGHAGHSNKILWFVRLPRLGSPLTMDGRRVGASGVAHDVQAADSSPGEIYPSIVDVPSPGCWHFTLSWAGHRDEIDLRYLAA